MGLHFMSQMLHGSQKVLLQTMMVWGGNYTAINSKALHEQVMWGFSQGINMAVVPAEEAVNVLGVQGAGAALQRSHGGRPEVVRAARGAVDAGQGVAHPQRHVQHLLQLALQQRTLLSWKCTASRGFTVLAA